MPNYNPLTNAVGGAGATSPNTYYNTPPSNFGEYQYIKLTEIVDNFVAAFVGEGKILATALRGDINFHAHRALQELSYDVLKSCKSQEIEVCPSLKMPLPHDYVNYTKITSVDANGIEHVIYPTRHTSHPFAIEQDGECGYEFNNDGSIKHQEICVDVVTPACDATALNAFQDFAANYSGSFPYSPVIANTIYDGSIQIVDKYEVGAILVTMTDNHCVCLSKDTSSSINCGACIPGDTLEPSETTRSVGPSSVSCWDNIPGALNFNRVFTSTVGGVTLSECELDSNAWANYSSSSSGSTSINSSSSNSSPAVDVDNYFQNMGQRYGLQPEHAQTNGSFFIDCMRGQIHFSSNLAGQTIILHYISDHHGTEDEEIVHKFAEEAMYKWIAYGCLSARVGIPENVVQRFKKEKSAETRKAKIRLSNIKIEEISQVMRNKSKWIKH
jgi:hypothetical protein